MSAQHEENRQLGRATETALFAEAERDGLLIALRAAQVALNAAPRFKVPGYRDSYEVAAIVDAALARHPGRVCKWCSKPLHGERRRVWCSTACFEAESGAAEKSL